MGLFDIDNIFVQGEVGLEIYHLIRCICFPCFERRENNKLFFSFNFRSTSSVNSIRKVVGCVGYPRRSGRLF